MPEFLLDLFPRSALATLSLADLEEFAQVWESGEMRFVNEVRCDEHSGPVTPELAALALQIPPGAPFIQERFVRIAKEQYGNGTFSRLEWQEFDNADGSIDIHLSYDSRHPSTFIPDLSYQSIPGWLYGIRYQDTRYKHENKSLAFGLQFSEQFASEPRIYGSWSDNTLDRGLRFFSAAASVGDDWRKRLGGTVDASRMRERTARLDVMFGEKDMLDLGELDLDAALVVGVYSNDHFVLSGDPTLDGTAPRSDVAQSGQGAYVGVAFGSTESDHLFTPADGHRLSLRLEQHMGDFKYSSIDLDARRYMPVGNLLGLEADEPCDFGCEENIARFMPPASLALQGQVVFMSGDVPIHAEQLPASGEFARGHRFDRYFATKVLAARAEYRLALTPSHANEAFVFTDHAFFGESLNDLEALDSFGLGTLITLPIYGGVKAGVQYSRAFDGSEDGFSLAMNYQF